MLNIPLNALRNTERLPGNSHLTLLHKCYLCIQAPKEINDE